MTNTENFLRNKAQSLTVGCLFYVCLQMPLSLYASPEVRMDPLKCLYGYVDEDGSWLIDPRFDEAEPFENGFAFVEKNLKMGIIDESGNFIHEELYWKIRRMCRDEKCKGNIQYFRVYPDGLEEPHQILDSEGKLYFKEGLKLSYAINDCGYSYIEKVNGTIGYFHLSGTSWFVHADKLWSMCNKSPQYTSPLLRDTIAMVEVGGKYGVVGHEFKWRMIPEFDSIVIHPFGLFIAWKEEKAAIYNKYGNKMTPHVYENIHGFSPEGLAVAEFMNKIGVINSAGLIVVPFVHNSISFFMSQRVAVYEAMNGKFGLVNNKGKYLSAPVYDSIKAKSSSLQWYESGRRNSYSDKLPEEDKEAFFLVYKDGKAGLYRGDGFQLSGVDYDVAVNNDKMPVLLIKDNSVSIYNPGGKVKDLSEVIEFDEKGYTVMHSYIFNKEGTLLFPGKIRVKGKKGNNLVITSEGKYGMVTMTGEELLEPKYGFIGVKYSSNTFNEQGYAYIVEGDKIGVINYEGKFLIEPGFKLISKFIPEMNGYWVAADILPKFKDSDVSTITGINWDFFSIEDAAFTNLKLDKPFQFAAKDSTAVFKKNGKYGLAAHDFNILLDPVYENIVPNPNKTYWVKEAEEQWSLMKDGIKLIENIKPFWIFNGDKALVNKEDGFAIIDKSGNITELAPTVIELDSVMAGFPDEEFYEPINVIQSTGNYPEGKIPEITWSKYIYNYNSGYSFSASFPVLQDNIEFSTKMQNTVFDIVMSENHIRYLPKPTYLHKNVLYQKEHFTVPRFGLRPSPQYRDYSQSHQVFTFNSPFISIFQRESTYPPRSESYKFITVYLTDNGKYEKIQLKDLIKLEDDSPLYEILLANMDNVKVNSLRYCPTEEGWDEVFEQYFAISSVGIHFILPVSLEGKGTTRLMDRKKEFFLEEASFTVPWETLEPYLKDNMLTEKIRRNIE